MEWPPDKDLMRPHQPKDEQTTKDHDSGIDLIGVFLGLTNGNSNLCQYPSSPI